MSLLPISERIASLSDTHKECMTLISRLSKLTAPPTDPARSELATVIHQTLRDAETEYELLDDEINSLPPTHPSVSALKSRISKTGEDLKIARRSYRKAQLSSAAAERDALFSGRRSAPKNEKVSQKELLVSASSDVTSALRRTQRLLQGELSRSQFASETLAQSTEALKELGERYSAFDDVVGKSRELIRDLVKKNKSDRWYYEMAIKMLVATLVWIVIRRLFYGPIYLLLVWPMKMAWWFTAGMVGLGMKAVPGMGETPSLSTAGEVYIPTYSEMAVPTTATTADVVVDRAGAGGPVIVEIPEVHMYADVEAEQAVKEPVEVDEPEMHKRDTNGVNTKGELNEDAADGEREGEADAADAQSMSEIVAKIIDGGSTTIIRNPKSRRFEEELEPAQEQPTEAPESVRDEL